MPNVAKSGGGISVIAGGGFGTPLPLGVNDWVEALYRDLKNYILTRLDNDLFEIVEGFPSQATITRRLPFKSTIIHFEIDDIRSPPLGLGESIVDNVFNDTDNTVNPVEGSWHTVNFDIGVWASAGSGGSTARLRAYQALSNSFNGPSARLECVQETGIKITDFTGGRFAEESIDDQPVWRVMNMTLVVQVFSRKVANVAIPYINLDSVFQEPQIEADNVIITG